MCNVCAHVYIYFIYVLFVYTYMHTHTYCLFGCPAFLLWHMGSFSCSVWDLVPWAGIKPGSLHWECGVLVTGPLGKSCSVVFFKYQNFDSNSILIAVCFFSLVKYWKYKWFNTVSLLLLERTDQLLITASYQFPSIARPSFGIDSSIVVFKQWSNFGHFRFSWIRIRGRYIVH